MAVKNVISKSDFSEPIRPAEKTRGFDPAAGPNTRKLDDIALEHEKSR